MFVESNVIFRQFFGINLYGAIATVGIKLYFQCKIITKSTDKMPRTLGLTKVGD